MKLLTKTCLAALLCSSALASAATAQQLGPISESKIDFSDFAGANSLPLNPLPGSADVSTIPAGPTLSRLESAESSLRALANPGGSGTRTPTPATPPNGSTSVAKPSTSIDGEPTANSVIGTGDEIYDDGGYYEGDVYEGVIEGEPYEVHTVLGLSAIGYRRNYGDDRLLSNNFTDRGDTLTSSDADHRDIGGFEAYLNCRDSSGVGWEFRYFGLDPSDNTATLGNAPTTVLVGLNDIAIAPGEESVAGIFSNGNFHSVTRESSIYNFEFNFLRNRSNLGWFNGMLGNTETLIGLRYFDFDESLRYESGSDTGSGPRSVALNSSVENQLFGLQTGGRSEFHLFNRFNASVGLKFGAFYTRARANRSINGTFADGSDFDPSIQNGSTTIGGFNFSGSESDVSFLAELDLGLIYTLSQSSRLRLGYRRLGLSGLAFASNNIPDDLANVSQLREVNDSQSLRLRGIYFAYELAF